MLLAKREVKMAGPSSFFFAFRSIKRQNQNEANIQRSLIEYKGFIVWLLPLSLMCERDMYLFF